MENETIRRLTPEKAVEIFRKNGLEINLEQARIILDFLFNVANVAVKQYRNEKC